MQKPQGSISSRIRSNNNAIAAAGMAAEAHTANRMGYIRAKPSDPCSCLAALLHETSTRIRMCFRKKERIRNNTAVPPDKEFYWTIYMRHDRESRLSHHHTLE